MTAAPGVLILDPGLFTSVQDLGRPGHRHQGVPTTGAFDKRSIALANALLGNEASDAVLEMTLRGVTLSTELPIGLALIGANAIRYVSEGSDLSISAGSTFLLLPGDRLRVSPETLRSYLAVCGGWQSPVVLGSRSTELPLRMGDRLACLPSRLLPHRRDPTTLDPPPDETNPIRLLPGPDHDRFDPDTLAPGVTFRVDGRSNRVGLRLDGPTCPVSVGPGRLSTPVSPGAVQVAGDRPMILGVACGTMGGYPHVAHVISADLDRIAQLAPGTAVSFRWVDLPEARRADAEARHLLASEVRRITALSRDLLRPPVD